MANFLPPDPRKTIKIHENQWDPWKSMKSLESSKGFYTGSRLFLKAGTGWQAFCHQIHEKPSKSMKIYEINKNLWKAWNRANVSIGAAGWALRLANFLPPDPRKTIKINENRWNQWKSMQSLKPSKGFCRGSRLSLKAGKLSATRSTKNHQNQWKSMKSMKIHRAVESSNHRVLERSAAEAVACK